MPKNFVLRRCGGTLLVTGLVTALLHATPAFAQDPAPPPTAPPTAGAPGEGAGAQPQSPPPPPPPPITPPPPPEKREPTEVTPTVPGGQGGGASGSEAGSTFASDWKPRLLVPRYGEDYYPAMPKEDGILRGIGIEENSGLRFSFHGYFRAPMRMTKAARPEGSTKENEGQYNYRTPYLIDDDYFRSGFAYTPVNESDWAELYFSVGNEKVTATLSLQGTLFSDAARPIIDRQPGVAQGWLTYRTKLDFIPWFDRVRLRVKGGAFWERFGHLPKYDTYIFSRIHQMGENVRLEFDKDAWTLWLQHGVGTHLEDISANQGLTFIHYASAGVSWDRTVELGTYVFDASARDKRPLKELTDAHLGIIGVDLRADTHYAGKAYAATSYISAEQATFQSPALEVMHSFGGRGLTENYFGTQASENGTGSLWNVGFQYDLSLADTYKMASGSTSSPLPWNGDVFASLFGLYSFVNSKQASPDPLINKDGRKSFKWGAEAGYRVTEWMAFSTRYDRVVLDVGDSANSFRILSPRLAFFTSFLTREILYVQYSRYMYNERIRLRPGQVQLENIPDDHVVKIQAQMTF